MFRDREKSNGFNLNDSLTLVNIYKDIAKNFSAKYKAVFIVDGVKKSQG